MLTYAANLIGLEKQLSRRQEMLSTLADGIERARKQADYFGSPIHDNVIASIAATYGETISRLKPRVIVRGRPEYLRRSGNTDRIRALLLAGIRGAFHWRISGGSHWRLLLGRKGLRREAAALLNP